MNYIEKLKQINQILKQLEPTAHSNEEPLSNFFNEEQLLELKKFMFYVENNLITTFDQYINMRIYYQNFDEEHIKEIEIKNI